MSEQKKTQKQGAAAKKEHGDSEGMAQGADAADPSSLKKEIDFDGQKPDQHKKAS